MSYIAVIGGANVDMIGTPYMGLKRFDSSPGALVQSAGGVARNITENLACAGLECKFISVFGADSNGDFLKKSLSDISVDLSLSLTVRDMSTSVYLCLNDAKGEMQYALSAMDILNKMDEDFFEERLGIINQAEYVVADTNLLEGLGVLLKKITAPVIIDPVSAQKALICKDCLKNVFLIKPNKIEAQAISGVEIKDKADVIKAADAILAKGNKNVIITLGKKGLYYANAQERGFLQSEAKKTVCTTGAGDSFLAGVIYGLQAGLGLGLCARLGNKLAALALQSAEAVNGCCKLPQIYKELISKGAI